MSVNAAAKSGFGKCGSSPLSFSLPGTDKAKALDSYRKAKDALGLIPNKRKSLEATMGEIQTKIDAELKLIEPGTT